MNARTVLTLAFALVAGCGGGGSSGGPPAVSSGFLYVNVSGGPNFFQTSINGFAVYTNGALSPVPGSPAPAADNGGGPLAITRDSKLLYTINYAPVAFQINADGSLTNAPVPSYSTSQTPVGLVAHPTADFLYVSGNLGNPGVLTVFAIDSATGALSPTSSVTWNRFPQNSAAITPNGQFLYQNDLDHPGGGFPASVQVAGFSIDAATGALSPVAGSPLTLTTPSPSTTSSTGPMAIDPTGKFLYVPYQFVVVNVGTDGGLAAYSIDPTSGALTAVPGSPFSVGGAPNSFAIDASGRFLIVSLSPRNGGGPGNCLAVLSIDPGTGALTAVPGSPFGPQQLCGGVVADPSAPFVYVGTITPAALLVLSIDQTTGALTPIGQRAFPNAYGLGSIALTH